MPKRRKIGTQEFKEALKSAIKDDLVDGDGHGFIEINAYMVHFHPWHKDLIRMAFMQECSDGKTRLCLGTMAMHGWMIMMAGITDCRSYIGRGFQTAEYARRLREWAEPEPAGEAAAPAAQ